MRVLVAGATGAIGRPLISALVASRWEVIGITSTERGVQTLRDKSAEAFLADALDRNAIEAVIRKVRPEAVIDELTSLPEKYTPEEMRAAAERDRKLRLVGGRNVQDAAIAAGARRYIVQSTGFFYAPGTGLATETEPLASEASPGIAGSVRTYTQIEDRVLKAPIWRELPCATAFSTGLEPTTIPPPGASPSRCANNNIRSSVQARVFSRSCMWRMPRSQP